MAEEVAFAIASSKLSTSNPFMSSTTVSPGSNGAAQLSEILTAVIAPARALSHKMLAWQAPTGCTCCILCQETSPCLDVSRIIVPDRASLRTPVCGSTTLAHAGMQSVRGPCDSVALVPMDIISPDAGVVKTEPWEIGISRTLP